MLSEEGTCILNVIKIGKVLEKLWLFLVSAVKIVILGRTFIAFNLIKIKSSSMLYIKAGSVEIYCTRACQISKIIKKYICEGLSRSIITMIWGVLVFACMFGIHFCVHSGAKFWPLFYLAEFLLNMSDHVKKVT